MSAFPRETRPMAIFSPILKYSEKGFLLLDRFSTLQKSVSERRQAGQPYENVHPISYQHVTSVKKPVILLCAE